jgi:stearoyl-CoA desaturase (delta-9 desaturase)
MTRASRIANVLGVFVPVAGFLAAIGMLWDRFVGPADLAILAVGYVLTGLGITVGFHRLLTHRSFEAPAPVRGLFAILGSMAVQGPVIHWVADHRKHHAFTDEEGDPHSPHLSGRGGMLGSLSGLWHAHAGWLFSGSDRATPQRYARDLLADRTIRAVSRTFVLWVALGLAVPFGIGLALTGTLRGGLIALLWGGLVRIFLLHHVTFAINSLCHFLGRRRFQTRDESRNLFWLAPLSFGEAWHNNHHAFPTSAFHGLRGSEVDPGGWVILVLERLKLARRVRRVPTHLLAARGQRASSSVPAPQTLDTA